MRRGSIDLSDTNRGVCIGIVDTFSASVSRFASSVFLREVPAPFRPPTEGVEKPKPARRRDLGRGGATAVGSLLFAIEGYPPPGVLSFLQFQSI